MAIAAATADAVPRTSSYDPSWSAGTTRDSEPPLPEVQSEMSFWDVLDVINPLQHIPIVGDIYREVTGDTINPASSVMGGILFGGPIGGLVAVTNEVVEQSSGKSMGGHLVASLGFGGEAGSGAAGGTELAQAGAQPPATSWATPSTPAERAAASAAVARLATEVASQPSQARSTEAQPAQTAQLPQARALQTQGLQTQAPQIQTKGADQARTVGDNLRAGNDPFAAPDGGRRPSRMPARDTILASTTMARHATPQQSANLPGTTGALAARFPFPAAAPAAGKPATPAMMPASATPAGVAAPAVDQSKAAASAPDMAAGPAPVAPDMISETMMRNLAKYEQSRKAAQNAPPALRVSG